MVRFMVCLSLLALAAPNLACAEPGPSGPIFRRATPARAAQPVATPKATDKLDVPQPFSPPAEALAVNVTQESTGGAEVDVEEVQRRGDRVVRAGRGPMGGSDRAISDAMAPPPDDSHKWFFTIVIEKGERESDTLLYDLKHSPELRAWANPDEAKDSWSHVNVYVKGDQSQDWRFKNLQVSKYPCMVLQPPAKLASDADPKSWEWGDPATVVWQWDGYDVTLPARATLRADAIRKAVTTYATKYNERRQKYASAPAATPGAKQPGSPSSEIGAPPMPAMPGTPTNVFAQNPSGPSAGGQQPTESQGGLSLLLTALGMLTTGTGATNTLLLTVIGLKIFELIARKTPNKLDDQIAAFFRGIVDQGQIQSQTKQIL